MNNSSNFKLKKIIVSILFGLIGFYLNFHTLQFLQFQDFQVSILAGLLFPLLITLFWGWKYGLLSALAGGCQSMWWLWGSDGYGILYAVPIFTLWIVWHGIWANYRKKNGRKWYLSIYLVEVYFRIISELGFLIIFRWLVSFNPPPWAVDITNNFVPVSWVKFVAIKQTITAYILLLFFDVLNHITPIRKFFLPYEKKERKSTTWIIGGSLLMGFVFWIMKSVIDFLILYPGRDTFLNIAFINIPENSLWTRNLFLLISLFVGVILSRLYLSYTAKDLLVRQSERLYKTILRTTSEGFVRLSAELHILAVNPAVCCLLGYREDEILGKIPADFVDEKDRAFLKEKLDILKTEQQQSFELMLQAKDNRSIQTLVSLSSLYDEDENFIGACSFIKDFREVKEIQNKLTAKSNELTESLQKSERQRKANLVVLQDLNLATKNLKKEVKEKEKIAEAEATTSNFLNTVINNSPFAMWIADAEGTVQRVNKSLCEFIRFEPEKIIDHYNVLRDKNLENQDLMPAVKSVFTALKPIRFMLKWKPDLAGEVDFKTAPTIFLKATMFPITNTQGELTNVLCQWIDITDLKEAEKKLIEYRDHLQEMVDEKTRELHTSNLQLTSKNKELQNFAYSVSHDLRAPLRSIIGFSEIVVNRYKDALPPEGKTYLNYILEAGNNMANLINDLLLYARLGKKETRQADLNKIFAEILRKLNKDIESEKAVIKLPENLPVIKSNPTLINQIFLNLIGNAINYHQPSVPPEITIKIKQEKEKLILSVKDNGIGIAEKFHDKIFSIFQRLHADDEYKGTGIGLAIAKKAVENLEGKIWLQSKMGEGTTFFVELPNQID